MTQIAISLRKDYDKQKRTNKSVCVCVISGNWEDVLVWLKQYTKQVQQEIVIDKKTTVNLLQVKKCKGEFLNSKAILGKGNAQFLAKTKKFLK